MDSKDEALRQLLAGIMSEQEERHPVFDALEREAADMRAARLYAEALAGRAERNPLDTEGMREWLQIRRDAAANEGGYDNIIQALSAASRDLNGIS